MVADDGIGLDPSRPPHVGLSVDQGAGGRGRRAMCGDVRPRTGGTVAGLDPAAGPMDGRP